MEPLLRVFGEGRGEYQNLTFKGEVGRRRGKDRDYMYKASLRVKQAS